MANNKDAGMDAMGESFKNLIDYLKGYGPDYEPTSDLLFIPALEAQYLVVINALNAVRKANSEHDHATNLREIAFEPIKKLSTRITNSYLATQAPIQSKKDVKSINYKIQGKRASDDNSVDPENEEENEQMPQSNGRSISEQGFDKLLKNMKRMESVLTVSPLYNPNEEDLKISSISALVVELTARMDTVSAWDVILSNARIERNKIFNEPDRGVKDVTKAVKAYVKSKFGATSKQYRQISGLKFVNTK